MEKSSKTGAQIYGYSVCLVAVITFLITTTTLVNAVIDLGDPLHEGFVPAGSPSLASYENYKMDILKSIQKGDGDSKSYIPDDNTLRAMYESAKNDKIQSSLHQSHKSIVISSILIIICVSLFITHWRWMRKMTKSETTASQV
jgi:hypothetical protein